MALNCFESVTPTKEEQEDQEIKNQSTNASYLNLKNQRKSSKISSLKAEQRERITRKEIEAQQKQKLKDWGDGVTFELKFNCMESLYPFDAITYDPTKISYANYQMARGKIHYETFSEYTPFERFKNYK